jgi:hypothetical protein
MTLENKYKECCTEYINRFCEKQGLVFEYWVGDIIGGVASFGDTYFFNFQDIVWDINSNQPKGLILNWLEDLLDEQKTTIGIVNYFSYTKGLRFTDLNK